MTADPEDLPTALQTIGWTCPELARRLGCSDRLVRRWNAGAAPTPAPVLHWLGVLGRAVERYPAPEKWRQFPDMDLDALTGRPPAS